VSECAWIVLLRRRLSAWRIFERINPLVLIQPMFGIGHILLEPFHAPVQPFDLLD
jgi:hypothetical protein